MNKMKFALNIRKTYIFSIFLLLALTAVLSNINARQSSFSNNNHHFSLNRYTYPIHLGIEKTYSISQNNSGVLFFSTNKGILAFDGEEWNIIYFNKPAYLANTSTAFLIFADNFTGEIIQEPSGVYRIKEIKLTYPTKRWNPEGIAGKGDSIYIVADRKIWQCYSQKITQASPLEADELIPDNRKIYFSSQGKLLDLHTGQPVSGNSNGNDNPAKLLNGYGSFQVFSLKNHLIFKTRNQEIDLVAIPFNDKIVTTFVDRNKNLWVLTDKSLYCIKHANYFKLIAEIPRLNDQLKGIAKDSSAFYVYDKSKISFLSSESAVIKKDDIIHIASLGNNIIVTGSDGVFQLKDNKLTSLISRSVEYATNCKDKYLFISKGTLFSLRFNNNEPSIKELFHLKTEQIRKIIGKKNGDFVLLDKKSKIYLLKAIPTGYSLETLYTPDKDYTSPWLENIFVLNNEVYACNSFNIHKLEGNSLINVQFSSIHFPSKGHFIEFIEEDSSENIIYSSTIPGEQKHVYYGYYVENNRLDWIEIPIWEAGLANPQILGIGEDKVYFFENGKLMLFDVDLFFARSEKVTINVKNVSVNNKSIMLKYSQKNSETLPYLEVRYPVNIISLKFKAIDLTDPKYVQYSFLLEKHESNWSNWSDLPEKNFSNLPPGEYKLLVRAKTLNGSISDNYSIKFVITPPFYLQWYAWMLYIILFIGIIGLIGLKRKKQFDREKIKLERIIQERTSELTKEKEKTDELLANMLPKDTADELKNTGKATSHKFEMVTVLFSDIQGFTKIAEQMNPEKLIDELDNFFFQFDSVVEKYNIEKIKTIGDAYMAAGGIPYKNRTNPVEVVLAALEMQEFMKSLRQKNTDIWDLRIGVHTGAVIAGVVGHKRISYDIWGDTVNTASRMESSGEASKINISGQTYELVKEFFVCEYRGKMPVKYKGDIDMYFVKGIRPELSVNLRSIPNKRFFIQLQLLRILDLEEFIFGLLNTELPDKLLFHNLKHTKDVYTQAELLGRAENITTEEMLLLRTAALLHDTGFIQNYHNHEFSSIENCRKYLPKYKYSKEQIDFICNLILCTRKNFQPRNKLEEILIDANNDYFGRIDFINISGNLFKELRLFNGVKSEEEWFNNQIKMLEEHEFYTETARKLREISKEEQIANIKEHLKNNL